MGSEIGDSADLFRDSAARPAQTGGTASAPGRSQATGTAKRTTQGPASVGWGRGPAAIDGRKFRFDVMRAKTQTPLAFSASKLDRMDAAKAGDKMQQIFQVFGADLEDEPRIYALMNAIFLAHTLNGASVLQASRGFLQVDGVEFDQTVVNTVLGVEARRFYRAYADEIAEVNQGIIDNVDPMDPVSMELYGQLVQVAQERGLQKYPKFCHDSADACLHMSIEERRAVMNSKRLVLLSTVNRADMIPTMEEASADRIAQNT